jgi:hypothetical protein
MSLYFFDGIPFNNVLNWHTHEVSCWIISFHVIIVEIPILIAFIQKLSGWLSDGILIGSFSNLIWDLPRIRLSTLCRQISDEVKRPLMVGHGLSWGDSPETALAALPLFDKVESVHVLFLAVLWSGVHSREGFQFFFKVRSWGRWLVFGESLDSVLNGLVFADFFHFINYNSFQL